ncbi:MAG: glucose 1-dehydrogenase [Pseudomonadota bacterium]
MSGELEGKVAVVTGGASGIGKATVEAMSRAGAKVAIGDVSTAAGAELAATIETNGGEALFMETDVVSASSVDGLFDAVMARWGRVDCAFNNAGVEGEFKFTIEASESDWDRTIAINLKGVWLCMRREITEMVKTGGGTIVNTASVAGLVGWRGAGAYCATKHGVNGLTKSAALEYARQGVRVNSVCPGVIDTPMASRVTQVTGSAQDKILAKHPQGRFGDPKEVANAVVWLCSDGSSFTTGHALTVDGGFVTR